MFSHYKLGKLVQYVGYIILESKSLEYQNRKMPKVESIRNGLSRLM